MPTTDAQVKTVEDILMNEYQFQHFDPRSLKKTTKSIESLIKQAELRARIDEKAYMKNKYTIDLHAGTYEDGRAASRDSIDWYNGIVNSRRWLIDREIVELRQQLKDLEVNEADSTLTR